MADNDYKTGIYPRPETAQTRETNPPFYQFYKHSFPFVTQLMDDSPTAFRVFFFLVEHMGDDNAVIISQNALAEALKKSKRTIQYATTYLMDRKYLATYRSGTSNVYCLNADIVWQQTHENKKFAHFAARVYISESEQFDAARISHRRITTVQLGRVKRKRPFHHT